MTDWNSGHSTGCPDCDFVVPEDTKHAVNSLRSHIRNSHEGWGEKKRVKPQFQALVEATGGIDNALYFADRVIIWHRPSDDELRAWAIDHEMREDAGQSVVSQRQIDRIERRLRKTEEWATRRTLDGFRKAADKISSEVAETGTTPKPILLQYAGMNVQYATKEIAVAYPAPVIKRRSSGRSGIKAIGGRPKALPEPQPAEGVFRVISEVPVASSDG